MKKNHYHWAIPLTGAVLFGVTVSAEQDKYTYLNSTNRVTLSLRFGLNIRSKFSGIGSSFTSGSILGSNRTTPNGDPYNYDNGYVYPDDFTPAPNNYTRYWGYDNRASQWNTPQGLALYPNSISFNRTTATGASSDVSSGGDKPDPGFEVSYDRELLEKGNWHDLRFGVEAALNYMNVSLNNNSTFGTKIGTSTYIFQLATGTTPPPTPIPFQGTFDGNPVGTYNPGSYDVIIFNGTYPSPSSTTPLSDATVFAQDHFDADLWGGRLGPYVELPLSEKLDLRLSGGLAIGLLDANESWQQTLTPLPGGGSATATGGGDAFETLWGYYASVDATWQINNRWAVDGALQFQDLGKFTHSFQGRQVELDLSRSLFVELGISYSF
jgi:hypothetical protein